MQRYVLVLMVALALAGPVAAAGPAAVDAAVPLDKGAGPLASADSRHDPRCRVAPSSLLCEWTHLASGPADYVEWEIPFFGRAIVTVTIILEGRDAGWEYRLETGEGEQVSRSSHDADPVASATEDYHVQTDTHIALDLAPTRFVFRGADGRAPVLAGAMPGSQGEFSFVYLAQRVPEGVAPERPAANYAHPHLVDESPQDVREGHLDLEAAWFDDARLGDGLLDAHVLIRDLSALDFDQDLGALRGTTVSWYLGFHVQDRAYLLRWFAERGDETEEPTFGCELRRGSFGDGPAGDISESTLVMTPACTVDVIAGELHAVIPERSVGAPPPGALFDGFYARSYTWNATFGQQSSLPERQDEMTVVAFPFALGGPAIWSRFSPALDPPPVPPWYRAPFHEENLPDTLQVVGAASAALTFLGGLVVLGGRRRKLRRLLDRVDRVVESHESDARAALLALGELDVEFSRLFRQGRLTEAQYQVVTQRVASAATRFALRRELGLDDGVPGHDEPADGPARRIPIDGDREETRTMQR